MRHLRILGTDSVLFKGVLLITLVAVPAYAAGTCQPASKPDALIQTIANAEHKGKISTEVLRLMLPCPRALVSVSSIVTVLNAGFTNEQAELVLRTFRVSVADLFELKQLVFAPIEDSYRSSLLEAISTVPITARELIAANLQRASDDQLRVIAKHCSLRLSEPDLQLLLSSKNQSEAAPFLAASLMVVPIKDERTLQLLAQYPERNKIAGKLRIADARLWAVALRLGMSVSDTQLIQGPNGVSLADMIRYCRQQGLNDAVVTEFLQEQQSHWNVLVEGDVCSGEIPARQIEVLARDMGHPALKLSPDCVASMKAEGISDTAVLELTRRVDPKVCFPSGQSRQTLGDRNCLVPPAIAIYDEVDPLRRLLDPSTRQSESNGLGRDSNYLSLAGSQAVKQDLSQPLLISKVEPEYTEEARNNCKEGSILLSLIIDVHGVPWAVSALNTLGFGLDEKAVEAVSKWRFKPALKAGKPVSVQAKAEVNFRLLGPCEVKHNGSKIAKLSAVPSPTAQVSQGGQTPSGLRVEILQVQWNNSQWGTRGYGKGNVYGSQPRQGFNFTFSCSAPFLPTDGGAYYPASWKKAGSKLVIITSKIGNQNKHDKCELDLTLEPYFFQVRNSALQLKPLQ